MKPPQRYLNDDGTINWDFIKQYNPPNLTLKETQVRQAFAHFHSYRNVKCLLAMWGEYTITPEDVAQWEQAEVTSRVLQRECEECYRLRSAWGRGRKTATAPY